MSTLSYQRLYATDKSEFEGFACRSSWRNAADTHFILPISLAGFQPTVMAIKLLHLPLGLGLLRVESAAHPLGESTEP